MGLGDVSGMVIPKPVLVSPPRHDGTLQVRYFMPHNCHRALAITGAIGLATACVSPGTVIMDMLGEQAQHRMKCAGAPERWHRRRAFAQRRRWQDTPGLCG